MHGASKKAWFEIDHPKPLSIMRNSSPSEMTLTQA
jgi:hypothetical protein